MEQISGLLCLHLRFNKKNHHHLICASLFICIKVCFNFKCSLLQWTGIMTAFHVILNTTAWQNEAFPLQALEWNLKECCWLQSVLRAKYSVCALLSLKFWSKRLKQETCCPLSTERYKYKGTLKSILSWFNPSWELIPLHPLTPPEGWGKQLEESQWENSWVEIKCYNDCRKKSIKPMLTKPYITGQKVLCISFSSLLWIIRKSWENEMVLAF